MTRARPMLTPEGVVLNLTLAEGVARVAAFVIDLGVIALVLVVLTIASIAILRGTGIEAAGVIWLFGFFVLRNFYFALFELRPRGATPGKRALGIRVAPRGGGRLAADAVLARNLMRELEVFLPLSLLALQGEAAGGWLMLLGFGWAGVFLLFPLFNRDRLRVGDLLAGTWVVEAPRPRLLTDLSAAPGPTFTTTQLDAYGIKELHALEDVLRGRTETTMAAVATRIRAKIGWTGTEPDAEFLAAYYAGLRTRLEQGLLFGRRRLDKLDRPGVTKTPPPRLP